MLLGLNWWEKNMQVAVQIIQLCELSQVYGGHSEKNHLNISSSIDTSHTSKESDAHMHTATKIDLQEQVLMKFILHIATATNVIATPKILIGDVGFFQLVRPLLVPD